MNRGARTGAVAQKWLSRAEPELKRCGYYEDDLMMVVQMNYTDMPKSWFEASGLEQERLDDRDKLSQAAYDHKWHGDYLDEVANSIIKPEWFDACVDAHKIERLKAVFKPTGAVKAAHDPFDGGGDAGGYACMHGSIIRRVMAKHTGEIDETCDWATGLAKEDGVDWFTWDGDGGGGGLKRQVSDAFKGTRTDYQMFRGSLSGKGQDNAEKMYESESGDGAKKSKAYSDTFLNNRAQYYYLLSQRMYKTYKCVVRGEYIDPDEMISFESEGLEDQDGLRSELCRVPKIPNSKGLIQLMSKKDMKSNDIQSPNMGDSVMMVIFTPKAKVVAKKINFSGWNG